ncbi:hypothetical protein E2562_002337 [Oryza meyeriana var. granulata]|uniref:Peptidase S8/S53 domain-containing protein n=1 Tax=Oryza meyeriana var. granulata TaxID=110450 RepID=A0A6G1BI71_9ORYZ|nr:hypothetical protein E2562_002337 [Oryza meyeriana var. granulata]
MMRRRRIAVPAAVVSTLAAALLLHAVAVAGGVDVNRRYAASAGGASWGQYGRHSAVLPPQRQQLEDEVAPEFLPAVAAGGLVVTAGRNDGHISYGSLDGAHAACLRSGACTGKYR